MFELIVTFGVSKSKARPREIYKAERAHNYFLFLKMPGWQIIIIVYFELVT